MTKDLEYSDIEILYDISKSEYNNRLTIMIYPLNIYRPIYMLKLFILTKTLIGPSIPLKVKLPAVDDLDHTYSVSIHVDALNEADKIT